MTGAWLPLTLSVTSRLDWLFGLEKLSFTDESLVLDWSWPLPAWAWSLIVTGSICFAIWSYSRLLGSRFMRMALAGLRTLLLVFLAVMLAGPILVRVDEKIEQDWLLMLVDRSGSLQVEDMTVTDSAVRSGVVVRPISRDQMLRTSLAAQSDLFDAGPLGSQHHIAWLGFGSQAYTIDPPVDPESVPPADAPSTHLRSAIEQALQHAAGRPVSGVVLFTDGRSPQTTGPDLVRRMEQQAVSIFTVPLGSRQLPLDLAITRLQAPDQAFINDLVPVTVRVDRVGGDDSFNPAEVKVRLLDEVTGEVLDEKQLDDRFESEPVQLTGSSDVEGQTTWLVEMEYQSNDLRELVKTNNRRELAIRIIDRPIRVLYVDSYPRWEYRYLKNLLIREESIASSVLLLSADSAFAQEGDLPITRMPSTREELSDYDVIILGDVPRNYFSAGHIEMILDHIATGGAGLLWLAGDQHLPQSYAGSTLADLLPMRRPESVTRLYIESGLIDMEPSVQARLLNVLNIRSPYDDKSGVGGIWPAELPSLRWAQDIGSLKPTAEVLAWAAGYRDDTGGALPLVVSMRYGAGQSLYVATDETWRWRYGRGDVYFEQFWIQLIRLLGRSRVQNIGRQAVLDVSHSRVMQSRHVVVELEVYDAALIARELSRVKVSVTPADRPGDLPVDQLELISVSDDKGDQADQAAGRARRLYRSVWQPEVAGELILRVTEPGLVDLNLMADIEVIAPDDEFRQPQTDHDRLIRLAEQTGGAVVPLNDLDRLVDLVPNRARITPNDVRETIWDSPLFFVLFLFMITMEWLIRKAIRLV